MCIIQVLSADENIVLVEHKLGISMAVLKPLFKYGITELQQQRSVLCKTADQITPVEAKLICDLSRAILLVKGDFPPAINARKIMIVHGTLSAEKEVKFLDVIFSKHPKSPSAWHHRRWCLLRLFCHASTNQGANEGTPYSFSSVVDQEVALCERMCDLYPRNYYAWNHRLWLAQQMNDVAQVNVHTCT
jgi:protein prenyltransferase alpha subunit repeat containing protein 1